MASQKLLVREVKVIRNYGYAACNSTLHNAYGRSLRNNELCIPVYNLTLPIPVKTGKIIVENVCVGDLSGSPLVCDGGVLVGLLANREKCAPGAVHTFADIAHALQWLRRRESTRAFDRFVLVNNTSITHFFSPPLHLFYGFWFRIPSEDRLWFNSSVWISMDWISLVVTFELLSLFIFVYVWVYI